MEKNDAISRSAAIEALNQHSYETSRDYDKTVELLNELPALDVAPVVRCNACKYYEPDTGFCQYFGGGNHWDGYCNKGARMDGEAE